MIFGVTGDLARKKLMPAVYDLANRGLLPPGFALTGFARRDWDDAGLRAGRARLGQGARAHAVPRGHLAAARRGHPVRAGRRSTTTTPSTGCATTVAELDVERGTGGNHAFYLSVPPSAFPRGLQAARALGPVAARRTARGAGSSSRSRSGTTWPARASSTTSSPRSSAPDDVFRIDHYLGKETVQNLLALRFANQLFEPIWNANYVDHVQITMAEDIGIGGRAGYYDGIGAARDVIQNHLLQLLALTAMEEPVSFDADDLRAEKEKVLSAVRLPERPRQAHRPRPVRGRAGRAARRSSATSRRRASTRTRPPRRSPRSASTSTPAAGPGVPFYLRTGKRLGRRVTEIAVVFKRAPHLPFESTATEELGKNALVIRVQPDEGVTLRFGSKVPGTAMEVRDVTMDFGYGHAFTESSPEAYERLILDVLLGDPPLFPRHEEVELSWKILDPITAYWATQGQARASTAPAPGARSRPTQMMARDGRAWRRP